MWWAWMFLLAACGRWNFAVTDRTDGSVAGSGDSGPADTPGVPSAVCRVDRTLLGDVGPTSDLAITANATGFFALYTNVHGTVTGVQLDAQRQLIASRVIPGIATTAIGGVADAGTVLAVATRSATGTIVWSVPYDLSNATLTTQLDPAIISRDSFSADQTRTNRIFITGQGSNLDFNYVKSDGTITGSGQYTAPNPITAIAGTDGPNHSHIAWTESVGGGSVCNASDVFYTSPGLITFGGPYPLSNDCYGVRNETGPLAPDGMVIVWTTSARGVEARYIVSTGDKSVEVSTLGRAPRTSFDGATTYVAWIDEHAGHDVVHLATFDIVNATFVDIPLPGWTPASDEALEFVHRNNLVYLAILSADSLTMMELCP